MHAIVLPHTFIDVPGVPDHASETAHFAVGHLTFVQVASSRHIEPAYAMRLFQIVDLPLPKAHIKDLDVLYRTPLKQDQLFVVNMVLHVERPQILPSVNQVLFHRGCFHLRGKNDLKLSQVFILHQSQFNRFDLGFLFFDCF